MAQLLVGTKVHVTTRDAGAKRRGRRACYRVGKGGGIVALKLGRSEWRAK
jgi:hypothetical protein